MSEPMTPTESRCPWCSAALPDPAPEQCPSCGAQLTHAGSEPNLPGVTALDPEAILRARSEAGRSRGGLLGFLTGRDLPEAGEPESAESLAPPDDAVRREMLRLQLEAEQADAVAESVALRSDALAEQGVPLEQLNAIEALAEAVYAAEVEGRPVETPGSSAREGEAPGPDAPRAADAVDPPAPPPPSAAR